jgi:large subunit ribosomal protein L27
MAHTKAQGSVKGNRDSIAKRLGIKLYGGQKAQPGSILVRQRGSKFFPGLNVSMGRDFTLFSIVEGIVKYRNLKGKKFVDVVGASNG